MRATLSRYVCECVCVCVCGRRKAIFAAVNSSSNHNRKAQRTDAGEKKKRSRTRHRTTRLVRTMVDSTGKTRLSFQPQTSRCCGNVCARLCAKYDLLYAKDQAIRIHATCAGGCMCIYVCKASMCLFVCVRYVRVCILGILCGETT